MGALEAIQRIGARVTRLTFSIQVIPVGDTSPGVDTEIIASVPGEMIVSPDKDGFTASSVTVTHEYVFRCRFHKGLWNNSNRIEHMKAIREDGKTNAFKVVGMDELGRKRYLDIKLRRWA